jgi:ribosomal protein S18 acetylase RimI-like enzyme
MIRIRPLDPALDRTGFSCGVPALDRYFQAQTSQDARRLVANRFVATRDGMVVGYYTLSSASLAFTEIPEALRKRLPRYPTLPAIRLGRLAVDSRCQGQGIGSALLADAVKRALRAEAPGFSIVVEAKDAQAATFYRHHGFMELPSQPRCLLLPLGTVRKLPPKKR